jgi:outer membrane protein assembly factor BamB
MKRCVLALIVPWVSWTSPALFADMPTDAGLPGGIVVYVGCDDMASVVALAAEGRFVVQAVDRDSERVAALRAQLLVEGVYGRISARLFDGKRLPYVDSLVNAIVVPEAGHGIPAEELDRVLAPLGVLEVAGKRTVKAWPRELGNWSHWLHGPDNNAVTPDTKIGISRSMQWIMPPAWGRHHNMLHSVNAMVAERGRIYYIMDEAPIAVNGPTYQWTVGCRDAFNGVELWKRPVKDWGWNKWSAVETGGTMRFRAPDQVFRRLVAAGDRVYVTLGFQAPVSALDGRTGETLRTYEGTEDTATIQVKDGTLYLTRNVSGDTPGKTIMAVDADGGRILWERKGLRGITPQGTEMKRFTDAHLTVGDEKVFFLDGDDVVALDVRSGKEVWRRPRPESKKEVFGHYEFNFRNFCSLVYQGGMLYLGQLHPDPNNLNRWQEKEMAVWCLEAASGRKVWEHTGMSLAHFTPPDLFVIDGLVWTMQKGTVNLLGLDRRTGEVTKNYPMKGMLVGHHHRCYRNKATQNFYLAGEEGIEYMAFKTGALDVHHWARGACAYGIMPANGLIYLPAHACGCHGNAKLNGFIALSSADIEIDKKTLARNCLEKGPAYSQIRNPQSAIRDGADWPVFKHDTRRSGATPSTVPDRLNRSWSVALGASLTAPVCADGKVFAAVRDRHEVVCVDAGNGTILWRFAACGRVDSPPTYHAGRLYFGTRSGWVYCLTDRGGLVWRVRAAPAEHQLAGHGQLESVWPVHGTVFIADDKAYCVAGRSTNLDGGLFVYALDAVSGEVALQSRIEADTDTKGECAGAVVTGILVGDGKTIDMRGMRIDPHDLSTSRQSGKGVLVSNSGGLLDPSWYNSAFWKYRGATAQMLTFDENTVCGISAFKKQVGKSYPHDVFAAGSGYRVFAGGLGGESAKKGKKKGRGGSGLKKLWEKTVRVRAEALVLTADKLCLAGAPDVVDPKDPWGAFENRKGGVLLLISRKDGAEVFRTKLESAPVYDGMAVARGKLLLSLKSGELVCFGEE